MSRRDSYYAMSQQRDYVLQLLGSVSGESPHFAKSENSVNIKSKIVESIQGSTGSCNIGNRSLSESDDINDNGEEKQAMQNRSSSSSSSDTESTSSDDSHADSKHRLFGTGCSQKTARVEQAPSPYGSNEISETLTDLLKRAGEYSKSRGFLPNSMDIDSTKNMLRRTKLTKNSTVSRESVQCHLKKVSFNNSFSLSNPRLIADFKNTFLGRNNFTKGCKWSPDGSSLLSASADQKFRVFKLASDWSAEVFPDKFLDPELILPEGELIYDYQWYPLMSEGDPSSRVFVSCCRALPIHMWDACTGELICSYRPYNHLDEIAPSFGLGFSRDGTKLVCGFNKCIRVFQTSKPGREFSQICAKKQNGVISCFDFHPVLHSVFAAGSYLGTVGLYSTESNRLFCILDGHKGGITQLSFSSDGYKLFTGARMDCELLCWDVRNLGEVLCSYERTVNTQQRIAFALSSDNTTLLSGSTDGRVLLWRNHNLTSGTFRGTLAPDESFQAFEDCVNGLSIHPRHPLLATSSGQRRRSPHPLDTEDDFMDTEEATMVPSSNTDSHEIEDLTIAKQCSVKLWWIGDSPTSV